VKILDIWLIHLLVVTFALYCSEVLFINSQACGVPNCVLSLGSTNKNVRRRLTGIIEK